MAAGDPWYTNIGESLGKFVASDAFPVYAGGLAQAMMAPYPNDPKAQIIGGAGGLGAMMGQSNIAAKAAKRQADERAMMNKLLVNLLAGKGLSEKDALGPTDASITTNPDGTQKVTVTGNGLFGGWEDASRGGMKAPIAPAPPPSAAMTRGSGFLPFYLGLSGSSSGGAGQNLFGLTPEQIASVTTQDIQGGQLGNIRAATLFDNLQRQAMADYYNRQPNVIGKNEMIVNDDTGNWAFYDYGSKRLIDTGAKASLKPDTGSDKPTITLGQRRLKDGSIEDIMVIAGTDGSVRMVPIGVGVKTFEESGTITDVENRIQQTIKGGTVYKGGQVVKVDPGDPNPEDLDYYHTNSDAPRAFIKVPSGEHEFWSGKPKYEWKQVQLPSGYTARQIMEAVKIRRSRGENVTFESLVKAIINKAALREEFPTELQRAPRKPTPMRR